MLLFSTMLFPLCKIFIQLLLKLLPSTTDQIYENGLPLFFFHCTSRSCYNTIIKLINGTRYVFHDGLKQSSQGSKQRTLKESSFFCEDLHFQSMKPFFYQATISKSSKNVSKTKCCLLRTCDKKNMKLIFASLESLLFLL